jgi:hypothetical protein
LAPAAINLLGLTGKIEDAIADVMQRAAELRSQADNIEAIASEADDHVGVPRLRGAYLNQSAATDNALCVPAVARIFWA